MKGNSDKSHLLLNTWTSSTTNMKEKKPESEKLFEVTIDYKLNLKNICQKYVTKPAKNLMLLHAFLHI